MKKLIGFILLTLGVAMLGFSVLTLTVGQKAEATQCKAENAECNINSSHKQCCGDLVCVPFNEESGNGKCKALEPTSTPTCTPTPKVTETPTPTGIQCEGEDSPWPPA